MQRTSAHQGDRRTPKGAATRTSSIDRLKQELIVAALTLPISVNPLELSNTHTGFEPKFGHDEKVQKDMIECFKKSRQGMVFCYHQTSMANSQHIICGVITKHFKINFVDVI